MMQSEASTYIVANRLPISITHTDEGVNFKRSAGGLVSALTPVHASANSWWVGSLEDPSFFTPEYQTKFDELKLKPVLIEKETYKAYYNGLSNGAIWPLFHYFPKNAEFHDEEWDAYQRVNELYCESLVPFLKENDIVWVQDFHLMLLPKLLRDRFPSVRIGYFHHIPFPASEVFRVFPWRAELLEGLLGADVVGFHTLEYARHFISSVSRLLGHDTVGEDVYVGDRSVKVGAFPLGIDLGAILGSCETDTHRAKIEDLRRTFDGKKLILGVDRLDYTKGIPERLLAFEKLLERNPEYRTSVTFLQICVPSRTEVASYGDLRLEVERLVGRINGRFGSTRHTPLQYLFQSVPVNELTALYKRADVCLVTPLRDGLNLVCKEYVAVKDNLDGVLVLSEFAGASEEMGEAIMVNPYNPTSLAQEMETALNMSLDEQKERMEVLRNRVLDFDNRRWALSFLEILSDSVERNRQNESREIDEDEFQRLSERIRESAGTLLCIDYDAIFSLPRRRLEANAIHKTIQSMLSELSQLPGFHIAIATGQTREFCDNYFSNMPVWVAAENGGFLREAESGEWDFQLDSDSIESCRNDVLNVFERCVRRVPRSRIEVKETSIVWHFKNAKSTFALNIAYETAQSLNQMLGKSPFSCFTGNGFLEVRSAAVNKGTTLENICQRLNIGPYHLLITVADSKTDEEMFRIRPEQNVSVHIGTPSVFSSFMVSDHNEWHTILGKLIAFAHQRMGSRR